MALTYHWLHRTAPLVVRGLVVLLLEVAAALVSELARLVEYDTAH